MAVRRDHWMRDSGIDIVARQPDGCYGVDYRKENNYMSPSYLLPGPGLIVSLAMSAPHFQGQESLRLAS